MFKLLFLLSVFVSKSVAENPCPQHRALLSEVLRLRSQAITGHTAPQPNS